MSQEIQKPNQEDKNIFSIINEVDTWDFIDANQSGILKGLGRFKVILNDNVRYQLKLLVGDFYMNTKVYEDLKDEPIKLEIITEDGSIENQEWELGLLLSFAVSPILGKGNRWKQ